MNDGGGLLILLMVLVVPAIWLWFKVAQHGRARNAFWSCVQEHKVALARRYLQLVRTNDYGRLELAAWQKERAKFFREVVRDDMTTARVRPALVQKVIAQQAPRFDEFVIAHANNLTAGLAFDPKMSPQEFEQLCAEILRRSGWSATLTKGSGDQGVDVHASKGGFSLVVQCKLYGRPIGNKAVQEAHAAKVHMGAHLAVVASNQPFTPSAQQLASTTGTLLLHYTELGQLAARKP